MKKTYLMLMVLLACCGYSYSWNATAHEVIAQIAWDNMTPTTKQSVAKLLSVPINYPGNANLSVQTSSFQASSLWVLGIDSMSWQSGSQKAFYASLHTLNMNTLLSQNTSPSTLSRNYGNAYMSSNGDNLAYAIESAEKVLSSQTTISNSNKAIALRYLIHLVGDITQPFNVSNPFINSQNTQNGTKILLQTPVMLTGVDTKQDSNLYALWNDAGGAVFYMSDSTALADSPLYTAQIAQSAQNIESQYSSDSRANYLISLADVKSWAVQTNSLAVTALLNGGKTPAYNFQNGDTSGKIVIYNDKNYTQFVENSSKQQIYVAGMRLANVLNAIYDPTRASSTYTGYIARDVVANGNITNIYQF